MIVTYGVIDAKNESLLSSVTEEEDHRATDTAKRLKMGWQIIFPEMKLEIKQIERCNGGSGWRLVEK